MHSKSTFGASADTSYHLAASYRVAPEDVILYICILSGGNGGTRTHDNLINGAQSEI